MRDNVNVECFHYFFTPHARLSCYATVKEFVGLYFIRSSNFNNFTLHISLQFFPAYNLHFYLHAFNITSADTEIIPYRVEQSACREIPVVKTGSL